MSWVSVVDKEKMRKEITHEAYTAPCCGHKEASPSAVTGARATLRKLKFGWEWTISEASVTYHVAR